MDHKTIGKEIILYLFIMAIGSWILSIDRCGLTTLCNSHTFEIMGNMCALGAVIITILVVNKK